MTESKSTEWLRLRPNLALAGWLLLCFTIALISSIVAAHSIPTWYAALAKPPLNPPNQVFGPVWTVLYALMAVAAWIVWKTRPSPCRRSGLRAFGVQLYMNLLWSWLFFGQHNLGWALTDLVVLWATIAYLIYTFRKMSHTAAWLLVPYLAWVTFAAYLNWAIWRLNP